MFEVVPDEEEKQANAPALLLEMRREFARKLGKVLPEDEERDDV